jgi:hypothetical protein
MGGFGSGRQDGRPTVEAGFSLDINRLLRDCHIIPGRWVHGTLRWTVVGTGREVSSLSYEANLVDPDAAWMRLRYAIGDGEAQRTFDYTVGLITTRPPRGGLRWWFRCPPPGAAAPSSTARPAAIPSPRARLGASATPASA